MNISHGDRQSLQAFSIDKKTITKDSNKEQPALKSQSALLKQQHTDGEIDRRGGRPVDLMGKAAQVAGLIDQLSSLHGMSMPERSGLDLPGIGQMPDAAPTKADAGNDGGSSLDDILGDGPGAGWTSNGDGGVDLEAQLKADFAALGAEIDAGIADALGAAGLPAGLAGAFGLATGAAQDAATQSITEQLLGRSSGNNQPPAGKPNPADFENGAEFRSQFVGQESQDADAANQDAGKKGDKSGGSSAGDKIVQGATNAVNAVVGAAKTAAGNALGTLVSAAVTILTSNTNNAQTKGDEAIGLSVFGKWAKGEEVSMGSIKDPRQNSTQRPSDIDRGGGGDITAEAQRKMQAQRDALINKLDPDDYDANDAAAKLANAAAMRIASVINIGPDGTGEPEGDVDGDVELPGNDLVNPVDPELPDGLDVDVPNVHPGQIGPNVGGGGRGPRGGLTM